MKKFQFPLYTFTIVVSLLLMTTGIMAQRTRKPKAPPVISKDQANDLKKEALRFYKDENYKEAMEPYQKLVIYDPEDVDYNYNLGVCYLNSNSDKTAAIQYFVKAADKKDAPKDVYYQMGNALLLAGLFDEAVAAYEKYKEVNLGKVNEKFNLEQRVEYCYNAKEYSKTPLDVKFVNPGKTVNSIYPEYAQVGMAVDTFLFFTSNRKGNMGGIVDGLGQIISDVYYTMKIDTTWTRAKNPGTNVNSEMYEVSTGLTSNGDKLLIYKEGGGISGDIYLSNLKGRSWQKAEVLGKEFETKQFETGACISNDGRRIFFAADLKGSLGGTDIYMVEMDETRKWGDPVNLGPTVNTKFDEANPVLWHDGKTLFFASQGHTSMGGYDIFYTTHPDPSADWTKPVNIGYPLNTYDDDLYFTLSANARTGYVSAVKPNGLGDLDIWYFTLKEPLLKNIGILFRASIQSAQGLAAKDAMCSVVKESTGEILGVMGANGTKSEIFILLPPGNFKFKARSARLGRIEEDIVITGDEGENGVTKVYKLQPNPSSKP